MAALHVRVVGQKIAATIVPLAVTNPDPWGDGMLYEFMVHLDVSPTLRDGLREKMIEQFTLVLDEYIRLNGKR